MATASIIWVVLINWGKIPCNSYQLYYIFFHCKEGQKSIATSSYAWIDASIDWYVVHRGSAFQFDLRQVTQRHRVRLLDWIKVFVVKSGAVLFWTHFGKFAPVYDFFLKRVNRLNEVIGQKNRPRSVESTKLYPLCLLSSVKRHFYSTGNICAVGIWKTMTLSSIKQGHGAHNIDTCQRSGWSTSSPETKETKTWCWGWTVLSLI